MISPRFWERAFLFHSRAKNSERIKLAFSEKWIPSSLGSSMSLEGTMVVCLLFRFWKTHGRVLLLSSQTLRCVYMCADVFLCPKRFIFKISLISLSINSVTDSLMSRIGEWRQTHGETWFTLLILLGWLQSHEITFSIFLWNLFMT